MTNKQARSLIGKNIVVRHRIGNTIWKINLSGHWYGTIFFLEKNVFNDQQTTEKPLFNIYPVELVSVENNIAP